MPGNFQAVSEIRVGNAEEYSFSGLFPGLPGNDAWEETGRKGGWKPGWEGRRVTVGGGKREQPGAWQARGTAAGQRIRVQPPPLQLGRGAWQAAAGQRSRPHRGAACLKERLSDGRVLKG